MNKATKSSGETKHPEIKDSTIQQSIKARKECVFQGDLDKCLHLFPLMWDITKCDRCKATFNDKRAKKEENTAAQIVQDDVTANAAEHLHERAVKVQWVLDFTNKHNCWHMPTWQVVRDIVKPSTRHNRERFTELPGMETFVQPAQVFVSHCWGAKWGTLVGAVVDCIPLTSYVWIDAFAVRQHPGNIADLDFSFCIQNCDAVLLVTESNNEVTQLEIEDINFNDVRPSKDAQSKIAFFRVWCLVEIAAAVTHSIPLVLMCGKASNTSNDSSDISDNSGISGSSVTSDEVFFECDQDMLQTLIWLVNIEEADASVETDKIRILNNVRASPGGATLLNSIIKGAINGAMESMGGNIQKAALGQPDAVRLAIENEETSKQELICCAAAGGYRNILDQLLEEFGATYDLEERNSDDEGGTALHHAARSGHVSTVQLLLDKGANVNALTLQDRTPLMLAAELNLFSVVIVLLAAVPNLELRDSDDVTALMLAMPRSDTDSSLSFEAIWDVAELSEEIENPADLLC